MTSRASANHHREMASNNCCQQIREDEGGGGRSDVRPQEQQQSGAIHQQTTNQATKDNNENEKRLRCQFETKLVNKKQKSQQVIIDHLNDGDDEQDFEGNDEDSDDDDQYEQAMDIFVKHFDPIAGHNDRHPAAHSPLRERRISLPTEDIELTTFSGVVMRRKKQLQMKLNQQQPPPLPPPEASDNNMNNDQTQNERSNIHQKSHHLMPMHKSSKNNRPLSISSISSAASSGSSASSNSSSSSGIHSSLTRNSSLNYSQEFRRNNSYLESVESLDSNSGDSYRHNQSLNASTTTTSKGNPEVSGEGEISSSRIIEEALKNLQISNKDNNAAQTRAAILAAGELQRRSFNIHQATTLTTGVSSGRTCSESRFSRINRSFHASLRYDKSTAYRIHLMANARAFGLGGQAKSYNLASSGESASNTIEPRGIFRRYSTVSRNNSSTSSDSGHSSGGGLVTCNCGAMSRKLSVGESCPSGNLKQHLFNRKAATLDGASCQRTSPLFSKLNEHHPSCPSSPYYHHQRPLRASPKLQQSPSSVSSYSNTSSLFRDDGFEDDLTSNTTSEHSSSITSSNDRSYNDYRHQAGSSSAQQQQLPKFTGIVASQSSSAKPAVISSQHYQQHQQNRLRIHNEQELPLLSISQRVVTEIIETERSYVDDLEQIVSGYLCQLRDSLDQHQELFSNLEDVYKFNKDFLFQLEECYLNPGSIAACFVENASKFDVYTHYCTMYPQVVSTLTSLMAQSSAAQLLKERQLELNQSLPLGAYLLKPVQRILKYHILFKSLIKHTADDETVNDKDRESINEAFSVMTNIACHINEMKKRHEHSIRVQELQSMLCGWEGPDLTTLGELILEDSFKMFHRQKSSRHLLLFDNILLVTKKKRDGSLQYKSHIECTNLMLIETIQGQPLVFNTVPFDNPKALCAFQADNLERKRDWCLQMKEVIIKSFEVKIPVHVRDLLMSLTKTSANASSPETKNSKKCSSSEKAGRVLRAPNYLEKKRAKQQIDKNNTRTTTMAMMKH